MNNYLKIFVFTLLIFLLFASSLQTLGEEKKLFNEMQNLKETTKLMAGSTQEILPTLSVGEKINSNLNEILATLKKTNDSLVQISYYLNNVISHTSIINTAIKSITHSSVNIAKGARTFSVKLEKLNNKNDDISKGNIEFLKTLDGLSGVGKELEEQLAEVNNQMGRKGIQNLINNFKKAEKIKQQQQQQQNQNTNTTQP